MTVSGSASLSGRAGVNGADGATTGNYRYDGNLKRVKSVVNGKTIYNVYDAGGALVHVDAVSDGEETDYVSGPMGALARYKDGQITYIHNDHLGSAQSGTTSTGSIAWRERYTPFGSEIVGVAANDNQAGFTGHIKDSATGLNYMQARYYDPVIGRFLSIDPTTFLQTGNPSYFNRYAYTFNDPVNAIDPNGEATVSINFKGEAKSGGILRNIAAGLTGSNPVAGGGQVTIGVAVSFPAFDGAKFDAGVFGGLGATDIKTDPNASSLPSLPGFKVGVEAGISQGSVGDISGRETTGQIQGNIGKKISTSIVGGAAKIAPKGAIRNFINGPVKNTAGAALGFVASAGITGDDQGNIGLQGGLAKGLNLGVSVDAVEQRVCSAREGCQ